jgi:hypothetical protein
LPCLFLGDVEAHEEGFAPDLSDTRHHLLPFRFVYVGDDNLGTLFGEHTGLCVTHAMRGTRNQRHFPS